MIDSAQGLHAALHQLSSFADMLDALRQDADERHDYREFAHLSQSYLARIRSLNDEIKAYLASEPAGVQ
jgi:hypothetical protein